MFSRARRDGRETEIGEFTEFISIPLMPCIFIVSNVSAASSGQLGDAHADVHLLGLSRGAYNE